jgi:hypothetical protein
MARCHLRAKRVGVFFVEILELEKSMFALVLQFFGGKTFVKKAADLHPRVE